VDVMRSYGSIEVTRLGGGRVPDPKKLKLQPPVPNEGRQSGNEQ